MHYFLDPQFSVENPVLNEDEGRHAVKSLRLTVGDEILIGDGNGKKYRTRIGSVEGYSLKTKVLQREEIDRQSPFLSIAMAPTKNASRFEWFLEKATELGVDEIIPLKTSRTERPRINAKRALKIILSATKQSQRAYIPKFGDLKSLTGIIDNKSEQNLIAHCDINFAREDFLSVLENKKNSLILIGPEGDFSPDEIQNLQLQGFKGISLGKNRLRTETAGVHVAALFSALSRT